MWIIIASSGAGSVSCLTGYTLADQENSWGSSTLVSIQKKKGFLPGISARARYCVQKEPDTMCIVREFGLRGANRDAVTGYCRHNDLYFQSGLIIVQAIKHK